MISINTKRVVRMLCGVVLFMGPINMPAIGTVASAADEMEGLPCDIPEGKNALQAEQAASRESRMIFGEVLRMDGANYVVKDKNGKEVSFQVDQKTEKSPINQGDHISVSVDDQNHALWIRANRGTDRRTEHASADCNPKEDSSELNKKR